MILLFSPAAVIGAGGPFVHSTIVPGASLRED